MAFTGIVLIVCGAALSWAAEATARGRMGINSLVGIRIGYVTRSDAAWLAGHRAARIPTHAAAAVFMAMGVFAFVFRGPDEALPGLVLVSGSLLVLGLVLTGAVRANRVACRVVAAEVLAGETADAGVTARPGREAGSGTRGSVLTD